MMAEFVTFSRWGGVTAGTALSPKFLVRGYSGCVVCRWYSLRCRGQGGILTGQIGVVGRTDLTGPFGWNVPTLCAEPDGNGRTDGFQCLVALERGAQEGELKTANHTELVTGLVLVGQRGERFQVGGSGVRDETLEPVGAADAGGVAVVDVPEVVPGLWVGELRWLEGVAGGEAAAESAEGVHAGGVHDELRGRHVRQIRRLLTALTYCVSGKGRRVTFSGHQNVYLFWGTCHTDRQVRI